MLLLWYHNNISIFLFKTIDLQMEQMPHTCILQVTQIEPHHNLIRTAQIYHRHLKLTLQFCGKRWLDQNKAL